MIAIMFSYLYYFKGKKSIQRDNKRIVLSMSSSTSTVSVNADDDDDDESQ